jgi:hypothetical protein
MTLEEALAWLRGERSSVNWLQNGTPEGNTNAQRYDAAATEQAYWIVRAHREGLPDTQPVSKEG